MTHIQWTEITWNPVVGCSMVSPGCTNCYAMKMAHRLSHIPQTASKYKGTTRKSKGENVVWTGNVNVCEKTLMQPHDWKKPKMVFVCSMSDIFHPAIPADFRKRMWKVIEDTPQHTYQILTKRPENAKDMLPQHWWGGRAPKNIWFGATMENCKTFRERMDHLFELKRHFDFEVMWGSLEPLLEEILDFSLSLLDWVVVGGESGPKARPCELGMIESVVKQCQEFGVPVFVKQLGTHLAREMKLTHRKGGDMEEWPEGLKVREYPDVVKIKTEV